MASCVNTPQVLMANFSPIYEKHSFQKKKMEYYPPNIASVVLIKTNMLKKSFFVETRYNLVITRAGDWPHVLTPHKFLLQTFPPNFRNHDVLDFIFVTKVNECPYLGDNTPKKKFKTRFLEDRDKVCNKNMWGVNT